MVKTAEALPAAKRKKKKVLEKQIPERVAAFVPESRLYSQLLELEKRVDATIGRKKLDIQEALKIPQRTARTLRVYVFNTSADQPAEQSASRGRATGLVRSRNSLRWGWLCVSLQSLAKQSGRGSQAKCNFTGCILTQVLPVARKFG